MSTQAKEILGKANVTIDERLPELPELDYKNKVIEELMQLNAFGKGGAPNSGAKGGPKGGPKGGCFNCGGPHWAKDCPYPPKGGGKRGGGKFNSKKKGINHAISLFNCGANLIDIGGESTRPGSKVIRENLEWQRIEKILKPFSVNLFESTFALLTTF